MSKYTHTGRELAIMWRRRTLHGVELDIGGRARASQQGPQRSDPRGPALVDLSASRTDWGTAMAAAQLHKKLKTNGEAEASQHRNCHHEDERIFGQCDMVAKFIGAYAGRQTQNWFRVGYRRPAKVASGTVGALGHLFPNGILNRV